METTTIRFYGDNREKLEKLCEGSTTSRGKKMNKSSYLNALINYAYENKLYFREKITPDLKYKIEKKEWLFSK